MNKQRKPFTVKEAKIQASILLKSLYSSEVSRSNAAAKRILFLPAFSGMTVSDVIAENIKRKDALAVIAMENGFPSWVELKTQIPFIRAGYLNQWFASYDDARSYLHAQGGYLLPYKNQYFICDRAYIANLGLDPGDPDWALIEYDWANPRDKKAWQRLYKKWIHIQGGSHE